MSEYMGPGSSDRLRDIIEKGGPDSPEDKKFIRGIMATAMIKTERIFNKYVDCAIELTIPDEPERQPAMTRWFVELDHDKIKDLVECECKKCDYRLKILPLFSCIGYQMLLIEQAKRMLNQFDDDWESFDIGEMVRFMITLDSDEDELPEELQF